MSDQARDSAAHEAAFQQQRLQEYFRPLIAKLIADKANGYATLKLVDPTQLEVNELMTWEECIALYKKLLRTLLELQGKTLAKNEALLAMQLLVSEYESKQEAARARRAQASEPQDPCYNWLSSINMAFRTNLSYIIGQLTQESDKLSRELPSIIGELSETVALSRL